MDHPMGLNSENEKREWQQLQAMPSYKEALIKEVERSTCSSMQSCPYVEDGMAAAACGFDLESLVLNQLLNPWSWMNLA